MTAALRLASPPFTLVLQDQGAQLWEGEGRLLAELPEVAPGPERRRQWGELLARALPGKAKVQILFAHSRLEVDCQDVPYLSPRERRDVAQRVVGLSDSAEPKNVGFALDVDPFAEGGHQFWVARHPEWEMHDCVAALEFAGTSLVFATAWQRAFQVAIPEEHPTGLYLALEAGLGRLLLFHGRGLQLMRAFQLPGIDPGNLDEATGELLTEMVAEECTRTLQFVKQKYRNLRFEDLQIVGLGDPPVHLVERLGRGLRLAVKVLAPDLSAFLVRGMAIERDRRDGLNLVPIEIQDALKLRLLRVTVWTAAAAIGVLLGGAWWLLRADGARLEQDLAQAQVAKLQRQRLVAEAEQAGRQRLGAIRLQRAQERQKTSTEQLARLGALLFDVPQGISLETVDVSQVPGDPLRFRFQVAGSAVSGRAFSVGPLADYVARLGRHPGMRLQPLREVSVSDRTPLRGQALGATEMAITRFQLQGVTP